jgi:ComF family protein
MTAIEGETCSICGERVFHFGGRSGGHIGGDSGASPEAENICGMCRRARPAYMRAVAYGAYDSELRELIHLLKYEHAGPAAELLGGYLAQAIGSLNLDLKKWRVVPVPLHHARRRERGFNQAEKIARAAVRRLGCEIELRPGLLERRRPTSSQTGLTNHQRRANLRGAFVVPRPAELRNHQILLVDDVFTTGTTAAECSRVLLRAGARSVAVATVARVFKGEPARPVGFSHASFSQATVRANGVEA